MNILGMWFSFSAAAWAVVALDLRGWSRAKRSRLQQNAYRLSDGGSLLRCLDDQLGDLLRKRQHRDVA
jgi:hypothetical protein